MIKYLTDYFMVSSPWYWIFGIVYFFAPGPSLAWTSASISDVDVTVEVATDGLSKVTTQARFVVAGGRFHGFDLTQLQGGELLEDESRAVLDDGRNYPLSFRHLRDGRTRVVLAEGIEIKHGAVTFELKHEIDLIKQGALRLYEGRARLDWTPLIWDEGLYVMRIHVILPGRSSDAPVAVDRAVTKNYEIAIKDDSVLFTKFRPVRWYPMQVIVNFDPSLVLSLTSSEQEEDVKQEEIAFAGALATPTPRHISALPILVVIFGLIALILKTLHVRRVYGQVDMKARFRLLGATRLPLRLILTVGAAGLGLAANYAGSLAAGVPAFAVVAALWMTRREYSSFSARPGGTWRKMDEEDVSLYRHFVRVYGRSRRSLMDITTPGGVIAFGAVLAGLGYIVFLTREHWSQIGWTAVVNGLILAVPVWFASVRAELPIDSTMEGFLALRRWRRALARLVGAKEFGAKAEFWVREDEQGPIEVRLRIVPPPAGLNGIEIAGEVLRAGSLHRTRIAVVLRLEPGTKAARRLAACPHAAEHHLTPDLQEEIIVLRNRRGRTLGIAPLRAALALLTS
ncbi:MAG: hypothetical protein GY847_26370 [Proteobacteria bacterium]|nr:hypothetical protein [Pseudomonadota bacterium]